jgi:hypothetical protein
MTMPFHVMPFEKRFLKNWFSPQISSNPQVLKRWSIEKREKRIQRKKKKEKKLQESPQRKREVNILRGEKHFNFKDHFLCDSNFSTCIIPFQKLFPKSLRKFS